MTTSPAALDHRPLRAPHEHGVTLLEPPLGELSRLLAENVALARDDSYDCQGRALASLARQARGELLQESAEYTRRYRDVDQPSVEKPVLLTGHQPELYHPGVWFKNFALSAAARRWGATAVNLLIDNDTLRTPSIRVPEGSLAEPQMGRVSFDRSSEELPFEERRILDAELFRSFGRRLRSQLAPWVDQPLIEALWPFAQEAFLRQGNLGRCLSEARHRLEETWGLTTQELPLSVVCQGEPFRWLVAHVLAQLPSFRAVYNACLADYRRVHRVRSRTHPVPPLARQEEWLEAPYWVWSAEAPHRRRLFARRRGRCIQLSDLGTWQATLDLHADSNGAEAVRQLQGLESRGIRIRPRALLTTMSARLLFCDLFFHGIGGAKYDQLTDLIIERFFRRRPPAFLVLTATAKLPIPRPGASREELRRVERLLRELCFNPQRHVQGSQEAAFWLSAKQQWIESGGSSQDPLTRHRQVLELNRALQPYVSSLRSHAVQRREHCLAALRSEKILGSREYSFCLFPEASLRFLLLDI